MWFLIIDGLSSGLHIKYNTLVSDLTLRPDSRVEVNGEIFDKVIYTGPLDTICEVVNDVPHDVVKAASELKYNKVTTMLWQSEKTEDTWAYCPSSKLRFHRLIHIGNFINSAENYTITEAVGEVSYEEMVSSGNKLALLKKPVDYNVSERAYVVFDKNIQRSKTVMFDFLNNTNIYPLGRFGEWEYYNMDVCIKKAKLLCDSLT